MLPYRLSFDSPYYLLLIALVPALWLTSRRGLARLGPWRRRLALAVRSAVIVLVTLALAEVQVVRTSDSLAVLYLVDRSLSVPGDKVEAVMEYINRSSREQHDPARLDRAGVILFGREAIIDAPPLEGPLQLSRRNESAVDGNATNLAAALRLARASFPPGFARRVVVISDGNQTAGDALDEGRALADAGIGIDCMALGRAGSREVAVEKLALPGDVREGSPFEARVVLNSTAPGPATGPITGRLQVSRAVGDRTQLLAEQAVALVGGKQVFSFREQIDSPDFYRYTARFLPDDPASDARLENNEARAFAHVRGRGQVLVIEDWSKPGEFADLVACLKRANLNITVAPSDQLFTSLAELQRYDAVVLADVGRASGDAAEKITQFSDDQIDILVRNTQQLGSGLVMLGGPDSFGAGAWTNTALERAMPVDFQINNAKVMPIGALMLVLDSSGSMTGDKLEMSKAAAIEAVKVLGKEDHVGVVAFDSEAHWIVPMQRVASPRRIAALIVQLGAGGGTDMRPGMLAGYQALRDVDAAAKHMIVLTDGQTEGENFDSLARGARRAKITTSCVAVGRESAVGLLDQVARAGGGKFYAVDNPRMIPRIFMKEAMRVARPLVYEDPQGFTPSLTFDHEILQGIEPPLPPITGFVMTTPKDNPLVEVPLVSPRPAGQTNPLLASWQYGLGRSVALTTDTGQRWARAWRDWPGHDKLFSQMLRWAMRSTEEEGSLRVFAEPRDGVIQVVVTALDKDSRFLNFLDLNGAAVGPGMEALDLPLKQMAPGRYVGQLPAEEPGSYFLSIGSPSGRSEARSGVNVPYSAEFNTRPGNTLLLRRLAGLTPNQGQSGLIIAEPASADHLDESLTVDVFRPGLMSASTRQDAWPTMLFIAACLFLFDVFNRRVMFGFAWIGSALVRWRNRLLGRRPEPTSGDLVERLRWRKSQVDEQLDNRRRAIRFEDETLVRREPDEPREGSSFGTRPASAAGKPADLLPEQSESDYTARLLRAKRRAQKDHRRARGEPR